MNRKSEPLQPQSRHCIRHPADVPIEVRVERATYTNNVPLHDVSQGGLAFTADGPVPIGSQVRVRIGLVTPEFHAPARVIWCRRESGRYVVGLEFLVQDDVFRARMVEQICHIEHYRNEQCVAGRELSIQQAAAEWIERHAHEFPGLETPE